MKNHEILRKVIEKACQGGYTNEGLRLVDEDIYIDTVTELLEFEDERHYYGLIFSHDFAKAFWGIKIDEHILKKAIKSDVGRVSGGTNYLKLENWQYHLQQMVLEEEPLNYLEKFLDK